MFNNFREVGDRIRTPEIGQMTGPAFGEPFLPVYTMHILVFKDKGKYVQKLRTIAIRPPNLGKLENTLEVREMLQIQI